tara:strand:+ start:1014 stop:4376 length:3363 start_codon:yes stop_codon:yes gene_type:complete
MSGGLSDLRNYNIAFKVFLAAIKEYSGYIYGLDSGLFKKYLTEDTEGESEEVMRAIKEASDAKLAVKELMANILDRTVGTHSIFGLSEILAPGSWPDETISHRSDVIISCFNATNSNVSNITTNLLASSPGAVAALAGSPGPDATISMYDVVKSSFDGTQTPFPADFLNITADATSIDRFGSPTLSAHVIRQTEFNVSGRQSQHLPIFFSAIPSIEMSRCTPFLDIKFIHPSKQSSDSTQEYSPKMSATNLFRFDPSSTFDGVIPQGSTITDVDEIAKSNFTFMDLFTSTQVAVNANINSENNSFVGLSEDLKNVFNDNESARIEDSRVLDPFQPFLSLISMDLTEQGKYGGFLATREGSIKMKLHDKSRLKDFSPMLAIDEYSFGYFVIEMGWSHPEGKLLSNNTIGQYLDNLRTINSYDIIGVNYSFGKDNSVDITLNITTRGAKSVVPRVSAFSGYYSNLSVFEGLINDAIASYEKKVNPGKRSTRDLKEIQNKIRVQTGNISSLSKLVSFDKMKQVKALADAAGESAGFYPILASLLGMNSPEDLQHLIDQHPDMNAEEKKKIEAIQAEGTEFKDPGTIFYHKFNWLSKTVDPFECATRYEDTVTTKMWQAGAGEPHDSIKHYYEATLVDPNLEFGLTAGGGHVTLGKLISKFVGFPLSTCGVYDEVQIYFYPVNNHAAGARRHTTASIPIELSVLDNEFNNIKEKIGNDDPNYAFSVEGFIKKCQSILMKHEISAYRLSPDAGEGSIKYSRYNEISSIYYDLSTEDKIKFLKGETVTVEGEDTQAVETTVLFSEIGFVPLAYTATEDKEKKAEEKKSEMDFLEKLSKHKKEALSNTLAKMYGPGGDGDGVGLATSGPVFSPVNLEVFFETCPVVDNENDTALEDIVSAFKGVRDLFDEDDPLNSDGILVDKNILKLHVYDSNTITYPNIAVLGLGTKDQGAPIVGDGIPDDVAAIKAASEHDSIKNNYNWWKSIIASKYPTIVHGAANSVVKDININSNISGDLKKIKIVEAQQRNLNRQFADELDENFDETLFFPSSVVIQMMGMPSINRGASIFVDFGTGTSLDNIYTVNSVTHSITPGDFTTTINCMAPNQNIVQSVRDDYLERIKENTKET